MYNIIQTKARPTTIKEWVALQEEETRRLLEQSRKDAVQ